MPPLDGPLRESPEKFLKNPGRPVGGQRVPTWATKYEASQLWGSPDQMGAATKCRVTLLGWGPVVWRLRQKTSSKKEQKR